MIRNLTLEENIQQTINKIVFGENEIDRGVQFLSEFNGIVTATAVTKHKEGIYSIYGFDKECGLPRDNYFPRNLIWLGYEIDLDTLFRAFAETDEFQPLEINDWRGQQMDIEFGSYKFHWTYGNGLQFQSDETKKVLAEIFLAETLFTNHLSTKKTEQDEA